jgi:hypothetical protein
MSNQQIAQIPPPAAPAIAFSDDECIQRLATLVKHRNNRNLDEIAALLARLIVPIE